MSVERRYGARHAVDFRVQILYRKRRFYSARARNLSEDGMYLDVRSVTLPTGTLVELELDSDGKDRLVPAVVVHRGDGGVGVMFRHPQAELLRELKSFPEPALPPRSGGAEAGHRPYP
jgi:hypothetical protein